MQETTAILLRQISTRSSISGKSPPKGSYWEDGHWVETEPMEIKRVYNFPEIGEKDMYLLHHEEIESLALNIPGIKRIRFFMTFGESYLTHLRCLEGRWG